MYALRVAVSEVTYQGRRQRQPRSHEGLRALREDAFRMFHVRRRGIDHERVQSRKARPTTAVHKMPAESNARRFGTPAAGRRGGNGAKDCRIGVPRLSHARHATEKRSRGVRAEIAVPRGSAMSCLRNQGGDQNTRH